MRIVKYEDKYKEEVRNICYLTSSERYKNNRNNLYTLYCDYYLENEKENCFLALNDRDQVIGYILCAMNYKKYIKIFKESYYKKITKSKDRFPLEAKLEMFNARRYGNKYPSHLHINILPMWQHMGIGKILIDTLKEHLINESVNGIFLCCGYDNKKAQAFYEKNGFEKKHSSKLTGVIYSMLLRRE